ncbi:uncharacterized PE-PGRS family protein PE_PGRS46-like [Helianthus annuus]|uniref:uncharacterized PE-PGRS family protein PE_PGRS46-like n=1 Tax=Helianthus annuus TaxID=4232 RepID=UPI000B8F1EBF|nr:uncharacterized PE-PGRS family protein PE_PGRS46-like [Helianthus annuus]
MEASKKIPETGSEESKSIIDLTQSDNQDVKSLEKSCAEVHSNGGEATNGEESPLDDETKGHQEVDEVITVGGVVVSDKSEVVATGEDGGDVMEKSKKRAQCSGDEGGVVGGEPPEKKHNFKFRLFGVDITCYKYDPGPKNGEGSSGGTGVTLDGGVEVTGGDGGSVAGGGGGGDGGSDAVGGGGDGGGGGSDAVDGEPPVQQP